jgi:hypothetical protein
LEIAKDQYAPIPQCRIGPPLRGEMRLYPVSVPHGKWPSLLRHKAKIKVLGENDGNVDTLKPTAL